MSEQPVYVTLPRPPSPDDFCDAVRHSVTILLRDHPKIGSAITFTEGSTFANDVALKATSIYRSILETRIVPPENE